MTQLTDQPKFEVFPESETVFFLKVVDATITFVKDDKGKVTHLVIHQGGRDTRETAGGRAEEQRSQAVTLKRSARSAFRIAANSTLPENQPSRSRKNARTRSSACFVG